MRASAGVCIIFAIGLVNNIIRRVRTIEVKLNTHMIVPIVFAISFSRFAPRYCPIRIVPPVVIPKITPVIVCIT